MKWIKKFNEELKPEVYRRASSKFKHYGKEEKSRKLSDWADLQQFGFYNMHFANNSSLICKNSPFTKPELLGIYFNHPKTVISEKKLPVNLKNADHSIIDEESNRLVRDWAEGGRDLSIYFEFGFKPTEEAILKSRNHSYLSKSQKGLRWIQSVPMFTICLNLSEWNEGLEEYDAESKWQTEEDGREFEPTSIDQFYQWTKQRDYILFKPYDEHYFGIFSDRQSAQKFKNFFIDTMNSDVVKDKIVDVLRIISSSSQDLEEIFNSFNEIKIHGLYDKDPATAQSIINYFSKRINH